jgi:hypothetical protein
MTKTQIQMPDYLYKQVKRIAEQYEMSLAEVVRRGIERIIPFYPERESGGEAWELPRLSLSLKEDPFKDPDWREKINQSRGDSNDLI